MNTKEDQLCMDVLAAIAWADGEVSVAEAGTLIDLIDRMEYVDHHRVQEAMFVPHNAPSVARLETLEHKMRVRLLHDAYIVAEFCGGADAAELEIVKTLAGTVVAPERWPEVLICLKAYADYERAAERLWGVTHLG